MFQLLVYRFVQNSFGYRSKSANFERGAENFPQEKVSDFWKGVWGKTFFRQKKVSPKGLSLGNGLEKDRGVNGAEILLHSFLKRVMERCIGYKTVVANGFRFVSQQQIRQTEIIAV